MVSAGLVRTIVGIIGNIISIGLFLSPVPTFIRIWRKKDVEDFQFYPYVATVLNCMLWVFYGLPIVKPDSVLVVTINGAGLVIELTYLAFFCYYDKYNKGRKQVGLYVLGEVGFMVVVILITLLCFHTHDKRSLFVGVFCDVFNVCMYLSPLLVVRKVYRTKSVEYMPLSLSLASFLNGLCWSAYAFIKVFDKVLLISNGLGVLSGGIQLVVYTYYAWIYTPPGKPNNAEVQLPAAGTPPPPSTAAMV
ncbi:hypothetical protein DM860_010255 [Cuscuta australis]|uniref:Bidirectional sugar transporter SWEET n=1 Tax=Cuscuta australis TaxID=267555 RepID=A0A328DAX4_9ASTE|nr:hypothetical protein DM860_010255 [Cuscuta australis]